MGRVLAQVGMCDDGGALEADRSSRRMGPGVLVWGASWLRCRRGVASKLAWPAWLCPERYAAWSPNLRLAAWFSVTKGCSCAHGPDCDK